MANIHRCFVVMGLLIAIPASGQEKSVDQAPPEIKALLIRRQKWIADEMKWEKDAFRTRSNQIRDAMSQKVSSEKDRLSRLTNKESIRSLSPPERKSLPKAVKAVKASIKQLEKDAEGLGPEVDEHLSKAIEHAEDRARKRESDPEALPALLYAGVALVDGTIGRGPDRMKVVQVIDEENMIISFHYIENLLWLQGVPTKHLVDGSDSLYPKPMAFAGTKRYATVSGGTNTVYVLKRFDTDRLKSYLKSQADGATQKQVDFNEDFEWFDQKLSAITNAK